MQTQSTAKKVLFPFRFKILALNAGSLILSLGCVLIVGSSHIVDDKTSYILDFNFYRVRAAANAIENQLAQNMLLTRLMHTQNAGHENGAVEKLFKEGKEKIGMRRLLILSLEKDGKLSNPRAAGDRAENLVQQLDTLGWSAPRFKNDKILLGKSADGELVVGTLAQGAPGTGTVYVSFLAPSLNLSEGSKKFEVHLVDSIGTPVVSKFSNQRSISDREFRTFLRPILDGEFDSGARTWDTSTGEYVVGYQKLRFSELMVVGLIPHGAAFAAVSGMILRSLTLGLSILAIAIGLGLLFANQTTRGLREMARVTEQVAKGIFKFKVDTKSLGQDEIGVLAGSFNTMADKIDELMKDTVAKTETAREIKTVETLQTNLYPSKALASPNLTISGVSIPGILCGGDWWNYSVVREYTIAVVGKVGGSGKGLNAALLTAAAHGAFSTFVGAAKLMTRIPPSMRLLVTNLNTAVYEAGRGKGNMMASIVIFNTETGQIQVVNCGFDAPWIHRLGFGGAPKNVAERFSRLGSKKSLALGIGEDPVFEQEIFQLAAQDLLFWATPGFFEPRNLKGERLMTQERAYEDLSALFDNYGPQADRIANGISERAQALWGRAGDALPDDVTFVVGAVPKKAYFLVKNDKEIPKDPSKAA
jgi:HAMP domain-containing protein